jgi:uncharacterized protein involved in exopolysaccharide biosynthesis
MRARYTPEHPEIRRIEGQIADWKRGPRFRVGQGRPSGDGSEEPAPYRQPEVETLRRDIDRLKGEIERYQGRVEGTPKREQELAALTRDYNITQQNYQRLLDRFYEAKRAEDMEKRQQGEQFRVVDYAQPPEVPVSPNPLLIAIFFLALGLGAGAGIIVMLEMLDSTVKGVKQLEGWSGDIPCISAVPLAQTESDNRKLYLKNIVFLGINGTIFVVGSIAVIISKLTNLVVRLPFPF